MKREFINFDIFSKLWNNLGLTDEDLRSLEEYLCLNPDAGAVIQGTGGVRKLRWSLRDSGKSGGIRVLYIDFIMYEKIYLLMVYPKNKKDNISDNDKKVIKKLTSDLKDELRKNDNEKKI